MSEFSFPLHILWASCWVEYTFSVYERAILCRGVFLCFMRRSFCASALRYLACHLPLKPGGTSFNTQNPIPHKSQKTKGFFETSRAKECQRGSSGAEERGKEGGKVTAEGSDTHLGSRDRAFESPHSDHFLQENRLFRRFFCVLRSNFVVLAIAILE